MTTELTLEALLQAVAKAPADTLARQALADALEEQGQPDEAQCQRDLVSVVLGRRTAARVAAGWAEQISREEVLGGLQPTPGRSGSLPARRGLTWTAAYLAMRERGEVRPSMEVLAALASRARVEALVRGNVGTAELATYLTAPDEYLIGVYKDGAVVVGPHLGQEIDEEDRPLATLPCPGMGALDMTYWRQDIADHDMDDAEVVVASCQDGDVEAELADLHAALVESWARDREQ